MRDKVRLRGQSCLVDLIGLGAFQVPQWLLAAVSQLKYAIPFSFQMVRKGV